MRPILAFALLTAALTGGAAGAQDLADAPLPAPEAPAQSGDAQALSNEEMQALSGGQGVVAEALSQQQLSGSTSGNSVTAGNLSTGAVSFGADALNGFSGVGNFVVNTGANNTLQGSINISIVTTPGG